MGTVSEDQVHYLCRIAGESRQVLHPCVTYLRLGHSWAEVVACE